MNSLKLAQKKGMADTDKLITYLIGALVVVVLAVQLAPTMFSGVNDIDPVYNETTGECISNCSTPEWLPAVLYVIIGVGVIFLIWRAFGNK